MPFEPFEDFVLFALGDFIFDFVEREVNDVVVVKFLVGLIITEFQPKLVEFLNFLGSQARGMRAQIEYVLDAGGIIDFEAKLRLRVG